MLNLFKLSPLTYLLLTSLALNLALGTSTYKLHASKEVAENDLVVCRGLNSSLVLDLTKQQEVCTIQDQVIADYNYYQGGIRSKEDVLLDAIDNILPKNVNNRDILVDQLEIVVKEKKEQEAVEENEYEKYTDLDSLLPLDFRGVLESAHSEATNKN